MLPASPPSPTPFAQRRPRRLGVTLLCCLLAGSLALDCEEEADFFGFTLPIAEQLSLAGDVPVQLGLPLGSDPGSLRVELDGVDVTAAFSVVERKAAATLPGVGPGVHELLASVDPPPGSLALSQVADVRFETVELEDPDACEVLNQAHCLLPYPSSRFLETEQETPTGRRIAFPPDGMPSQLVISRGQREKLPVAPFAERDGFAPTAHVLVSFPQGVDLEASGAARLLPDTRSTDLTSLSDASPTLLIDAETGERILHWLENDARPPADPSRALLFLRPARALKDDGHYIVAFRNLIAPDGQPVEAEPAFAALRDRRATDIPAIQERRGRMEWILGLLEENGVERSELVLAFEFHTASAENLTGQMVSMRDQAFRWLAAQEEQTFSVQSSEEFDCTQPDQFVWKNVRGTYQVPLFLTADPETDPLSAGVLRTDAEDGFTPVWSELTNPEFGITIPCDALDPANTNVHPLVVGHGLFGNGPSSAISIGSLVGEAAEEFGLGASRFIGGGTHWRGLSRPDFADPTSGMPSFIVNTIAFELANFPALAARLRQGQLNQLVLGTMMKQGLFNRDPAFQAPAGHGVFPADREMYYVGISLGGIMGLMHVALSPDLAAANLDVGSFGFFFLLQRATPFQIFQTLLDLTVDTDPTVQGLGLSLLGEVWQLGESAAFANHIHGPGRLPDTGDPKLLVSMAWLDQQVTNQGTEITARTLGLPSLEGSFLPGLPEIPDVPGPLDSAFVVYSTGTLDPTDPAQAAIIPPLANLSSQINRCDPHGQRVQIPASLLQLQELFQPGGRILNFCDGTCDADPGAVATGPAGNVFALERPGGSFEPCDPFPAP